MAVTDPAIAQLTKAVDETKTAADLACQKMAVDVYEGVITGIAGALVLAFHDPTATLKVIADLVSTGEEFMAKFHAA